MEWKARTDPELWKGLGRKVPVHSADSQTQLTLLKLLFKRNANLPGRSDLVLLVSPRRGDQLTGFAQD